MRYKSVEDRVVDVVAIIIVALVAICCLYPIVYCFSMSLSGDDAIVKHWWRRIGSGRSIPAIISSYLLQQRENVVL